MRGWALAGSVITVLVDGAKAATSTADERGRFEATLDKVLPGWHGATVSAASGTVGFDYPTFKVAMGGKFDWRSFAQIANIPGLTAFASLALTAIGFVVSSLVTGEYKEIVSAVLKTALPQLTGQAPPH